MNITSRPTRLAARRLDLAAGRVDLTHGAGGRAMQQLIEEIFRPAFDNPILARGDDQAAFDVAAGRMVMSTDCFVVSPLFFPGGDIGSLAVHGTVNDVAMSGARPLYLSAGFVIEEGFPLADLQRIARRWERPRVPPASPWSPATPRWSSAARLTVFLSTRPALAWCRQESKFPATARGPATRSSSPGPWAITASPSWRIAPGLEFETTIVSDSASLNGLVADMVAAVPTIRVLRDPTRGGLAATLNEICHQSGVGMRLDEAAIPIKPEVLGACELLGLDALNVANEGKLIAIVPATDAARLLEVLRAHPLGRDATMIGEVTADPARFVRMATRIGGERIVDWLAGEQLPRIC